MLNVLRTIVVAVCFLILASASGCGNQYDKYSSYQSPQNPLGTGLAASTSSNQWQCPTAGTYNIMPPSGQTQKDMAYTVCRSKIDPSIFKITGYSTSNVVCVYSAMASTSQSSLSLSQDRRKCYSFTSKETTVQFSGTVNYMIIVDSQWTNALESCMVNPTSCPPYASGNVP